MGAALDFAHEAEKGDKADNKRLAALVQAMKASCKNCHDVYQQ